MAQGQDLSAQIVLNIQGILAEWEAVVRAELPGAKPLGREELYNSLPALLDRLALCFSTSKISAEWQSLAKDLAEIAKYHGEQRADLVGYTLDQVIAEHQVLRRILFQFIQPRARLSPDQWSILLESVDRGISEAATAFALTRGFKDARYRQIEAERNQAQSDRSTAQSQVSRLEIEKGMREQFVSTLSHDLRTPITSARLAAELIARDTKNVEQVARLSFKIIDDLSRSDRMIRDLLDANRIRSGETLPLEIRETKLIELIRKTLTSLAEVYGNRFNLNADREIVGYWSGADLERSIENLAINAVKYGAPDTPVNIQVQDQGQLVRIAVYNTGSLITPAEQEALFQPFSRIMSSVTKGKRGWGLGLTLVQGIAQAHGGKVQVESEPDKGTTFSIVIPKDARAIGGKGAEQARTS